MIMSEQIQAKGCLDVPSVMLCRVMTGLVTCRAVSCCALLRPVEASSKRACKQALEMFCSAVRTTLNACQGYECQEKDGIFMLAFSEAGNIQVRLPAAKGVEQDQRSTRHVPMYHFDAVVCCRCLPSGASATTGLIRKHLYFGVCYLTSIVLCCAVQPLPWSGRVC
jgi:hypothetical protein